MIFICFALVEVPLSFCMLMESYALPLSDSTRRKDGLDIEVFWTVAKFRPRTANLPQQLNTNLNTNLLIGWQWQGVKQKSRCTRSFKTGAFMGLGASLVSPSTTDHQTTREYQGLIGGYGLAAMTGFNRFTCGLAVGVDHLLDNNRGIWIYQQKPWYGLTLGFKLK